MSDWPHGSEDSPFKPDDSKGPVDHFWTAVARGWDIEPREYFEREAVKMGFKSPVEMAVHHMWKRHAREFPSSSVPVRASGEPQCIVCKQVYETGGQQTRSPFQISGPTFRVCRRCVDAGKTARRVSASPSDDGARQPQDVREWAEKFGVLSDRILAAAKACEDLDAIRQDLHLLYAEVANRVLRPAVASDDGAAREPGLDLEQANARITELETSVDYLRNLVDHPLVKPQLLHDIAELADGMENARHDAAIDHLVAISRLIREAK